MVSKKEIDDSQLSKPLVTVKATELQSSEHGNQSSDEDGAPNKNSWCSDPLFALLFLAHAGAVLFFATKAGKKLSSETEIEGGMAFLKNEDLTMGQIFKALLSISGAAFFLCIVWIVAMMRFAENMIKCSFYVWAIFYGLGFAVGLSNPALRSNSGVPVLSIACAGMLIWLGCTYCAIRKRIAFAGANLKAACAALQAHPMVLPVVIIGLLMSFGWCSAWALAVCGVTSDGIIEWKLSTMFLAFLSLYWGAEICTNVNHVAIAGTVSSWWFHPAGSQEFFAVTKSWCRAMTTSFGSICFGSLLVAMVEATHALVDEMSKNSFLKCATCCLRCMLGCIERALRFFNRYAFVYVGMHGSSFCAASVKVSGLFRQLGFFGTVLQDVVISRVLTMGVLGVSVVSGISGFGIGMAMFNDEKAGVACLTFGLLVGAAMASVTSAVVNSAVATVYVAFGESSNFLMAYHPKVYADLKHGWQTLHPSVVGRLIDTSSSV
jgi:hypothetical protein